MPDTPPPATTAELCRRIWDTLQGTLAILCHKSIYPPMQDGVQARMEKECRQAIEDVLKVESRLALAAERMATMEADAADIMRGLLDFAGDPLYRDKPKWKEYADRARAFETAYEKRRAGT